MARLEANKTIIDLLTTKGATLPPTQGPSGEREEKNLRLLSKALAENERLKDAGRDILRALYGPGPRDPTRAARSLGMDPKEVVAGEMAALRALRFAPEVS